MKAKRGFTLVELLVVISILVLLIAVLLPALHGARNRARAVACQAKLRQWGVVFAMYMEDHNDQFNDSEGSFAVWWWNYARPYYGDPDALLLCPIATRWKVNKNAPGWEAGAPFGAVWGSKFSAWRNPWSGGAKSTPVCGSYGWNMAVPMMYSAHSDSKPPAARSATPFLLDCAIGNRCGGPLDRPPAYDGDLSQEPLPSSGQMKVFCIDRHNGVINSLFMDWSVRRVGLKELWTLKWVKGYDTCGPWTKAGGVKPEDWPEWMRRFKDY